MRSRLLLVSGSLRQGSTNTAALLTLADLAVAAGRADADVFDGLAALPHFNPDDDHEPLPPPVAALRARLAAADAVVFSTPEYAGTMPGSFKNVLDWTVGGVELGGKPVGWVNCSTGGPNGGKGAEHALRTVLGYVSADVVEAACVHLPVPRQALGDDGRIHDADLRARLAEVANVLVDRVTAVAPARY
jgi:NAD(P)H-dependent FMN reductase